MDDFGNPDKVDGIQVRDLFQESQVSLDSFLKKKIEMSIIWMSLQGFLVSMLELSALSIVSEEVRHSLSEFLAHVNASGFMAHLREQKLPKIHLESDQRGGRVAIATKSIPKGSLVFFTDGPVLVGDLEKMKAEARYSRGGISANLELEVQPKHCRKITGVHQLYPQNFAYYADNACGGRGNLEFVNTALRKGKSFISISSFYAQRLIQKGERLSFQYYHILKRGRKKDGLVRCDCHPTCKNWLFLMTHPS